SARLDKEDVASDRCPGKAGGHTGKSRTHCKLALVSRRTQYACNLGRIDANGVRRALCNAHGRMTENASDLTLQIAHPRLAGVAVNDEAQGLMGDLAIPGG